MKLKSQSIQCWRIKLKKNQLKNKKKDPSQLRLAHQNLDWFSINPNIERWNWKTNR